jgi:hypothetical protein
MKIPHIEDRQSVVACPTCSTPYTEITNVAIWNDPWNLLLGGQCIDGHLFGVDHRMHDGMVWTEILEYVMEVVNKEQ